MADMIEIDEEENPDEDPEGAHPLCNANAQDYEWLVSTIRRLCIESNNIDEFDTIYDELITRNLIPSDDSQVSRSVPRFGSPFSQVYNTLETIGEGGYGKVLKVVNLIDKQTYALKIVEIERSEISSAVREVQCLAHLHSPNVVRYYSSWVEEKQDASTLLLYIQTEFIQGQSLEAFLMLNNDIEDTLIHRVLLEIVKAVRDLHAVGIVHRDLRPANIMFRSNGSVVIIDFGISSLAKTKLRRKPPLPHPVSGGGSLPMRIGSLTMRPLDKLCLEEAERESETIRNVGTPMYSSPRQLNGMKSTTADDIYSLGIIMYEMLAGFKTNMEKCKCIKALRTQKTITDEFRQKYPTETDLILQMTSPRSSDRPSAADILSTDLFKRFEAEQ